MTVIGSLRFARHELMLWRRTWYGSVFSVFATPVLYLLGLGLGVGQLVQDGGASATLGGISYAAFAGTGVLAGASMQGGVGDLSWPVYGNLTYTRTWEATTATPLRPGDIVGGVTLVVAVRLALAAVVFAIALRLFGLVDTVGAVAVVGPASLIGLACGLPMFAFVCRAPDGVAISNIFRFVIIPMFVLSGTFFPVSELPAAARAAVLLSPLWHGLELVRRAGLGLPTALPPAVHLVVLIGLILVGGALTVRALTDRLQP